MTLRRIALVIFLFSLVSLGLQLGGYSIVDKPIQITLERTGGFAGITTTTTIDTATLPTYKANQIRQLINQVNFPHLNSTINPRLPHPDRYQYTLRVEENGQNYTVVFNEEAVSPALQPLVTFLKNESYNK